MSMTKQDALDYLVNIESVALSYYAHVPNIRGVKRLQDDVDKLRSFITRAVPLDYVTEEECKRRCWQSFCVGVQNSELLEEPGVRGQFKRWYAESFGGGKDGD